MIVITGHDDRRITIQGHANYAPLGQEIVCASVSTLAQVLIASIEQMTQDKKELTKSILMLYESQIVPFSYN